MASTRRKEEAIGWDNIKTKKTPIGTNYPAMRARGVDKKDVGKKEKYILSLKPLPVYNEPKFDRFQDEEMVEEEIKTNVVPENGDGVFKKIISKIKNILHI